MNQIGPMAYTFLDRFIESIGQILPADNHDVSHRMQVIPLLVNGLQPLPIFDTRFLVMERKNGAYDWRQEQNHAHHDRPWTHALAQLAVHIEVYRRVLRSLRFMNLA